MPQTKEPNRRIDTTNLTTMVVRSFEAMGPKGRMRMRLGGVFFMAIGAVPPAIAGALGRSLAASYLIFEVVVFLAGLLLFWPDAWILFVRLVPSALVKVMPSRVLSLLDRRKNEEK